jgi:flagellar operon protein
MTPEMRHLAQIGRIHPTNEQTRVSRPTSIPSTSFEDVLRKVENEQPINFSKHASMRLESRGINFTDEQLSRVTDGIGRAGQKGIRDSLVLVDDVALVVNIPSRTVVTAIAQPQENVFSNIDGAVIV